MRSCSRSGSLLGLLLTAAACGRGSVSVCETADCPSQTTGECTMGQGCTETGRSSTSSDTEEPACDPPCRSGEVCRDGQCVGSECIENADCPPDAVCKDGTCLIVGQCLEDEHCFSGQTCVANSCVGRPQGGKPQSCEINADCPEKWFCLDNLCEKGTECLEHVHCPAGEACFKELCVEV